MNDNTSCLAIDENESHTISEMDKENPFEESSMRPQTSNYYDDDEEAFIEEVQNQLMLTSEFKNQGAAVVATPAWEKQNSYFGSEFHQREQQQQQYCDKKQSQQQQQQQQFSFSNEPNHINLDAINTSQSQSQFKYPSVVSSSGFPQNPEQPSNNPTFSANSFTNINSNPSSYGYNSCNYEGGYENPSVSAYQSNHSRATYGDSQNFYNEQAQAMGGYGSDKKAIYGYVNKNGPILYGRDDNEDFNSNNNNYSSYNNHNQHQFRGATYESVFAFEDDDDADQYNKNYDQHFKSAEETLRKMEIQQLSLYKNHNMVTKKELVNIVLIDKQTQNQYAFDQQEIELTDDKTFNVNEVIQLNLIQAYIKPDFNFYIAQEGDISEIWLGTHPVFDEKKVFQRVSRQGQITLLFQRPAQMDNSAAHFNNLRFQPKMFIQSEGLITTNPDSESKDKRVQERSVREALQLVKQWRCTYEETKRRTKPGYHIISLDKVANIAIKCKKKTLDYYFLELRKAEMYLYDFSTNLDSKMSHVRSFNAHQKEKHPQPTNPPNDLIFNLSDEDTLSVNEEDVLKLLESSLPNKKTQTGSSSNLGQKKEKEVQSNSRHGSFSTPEMSNGMMRQQGMQANQACPKIQKDINKMPKKGNNQYPFGVGGSNGIRGGNQADGFASSFRLQPDGSEMGNCLKNKGDQSNRMEQGNGDNSIRDNQNSEGVLKQFNNLGEVKMETIPEFNQQQGQQQGIQLGNDIPQEPVELKASESMPFIPSLEYDC